MTRIRMHAAVVAVAAVVAGCVVGRTETFTISGGEVVHLPVARGVPLPEGGGWTYETDGITVSSSAHHAGPGTRELVYRFAFGTRDPRLLPTSVRIEDVSGPEAELLLVDDAPTLVQVYGGVLNRNPPRSWSGQSEPMQLTDPRLQWLMADASSIRIHRYTITLNTGKTVVAYYTLNYLPGTKKEMRAWLE